MSSIPQQAAPVIVTGDRVRLIHSPKFAGRVVDKFVSPDCCMSVCKVLIDYTGDTLNVITHRLEHETPARPALKAVA